MTKHDQPFELVADAKKRAWLTAYAITGRTDLACEAAGVSTALPYTRGWREDNEFQEAREEARTMAADGLEDAARKRAIEGTRSYKFNKDGVPLRHPEMCECGHGLGHHPKVLDLKAEAAGRDLPRPCNMTRVEVDEETNEEVGLETCDCTQFVGAPYFEHSYSDTLLIFLTKGAMPERYREIKEVRGLLANLDLNMLPNALIQRIAMGEPIEAVLASGASDAGISPGELVRGALAPGEADSAAEVKDGGSEEPHRGDD